MEATSELDQPVGAWRLQSVHNTFSDTGERIAPYGENPVGRMVFEPGGRIMFLFGAAGRQAPQDDSDRSSLFDSIVAYTGTVRVDGPGRLITTVDLALNPAVRGEQARYFTLDGDKLSIRTAEQT